MRGGPVLDEKGKLIGIHQIEGEGISMNLFWRRASDEIKSLLASNSP